MNKYRVGSIATDDISKVQSLWVNVATTKYTSLFKNLGVAYQVPADNRGVLTNIIVSSDGAADVIEIGYGDDIVNGAAARPTTPITIARYLKILVASENTPISITMIIPAGKYPYLGAGANTCYLNCNVLEESTA